MRNLLVLTIALLASATAHADQKIVDCNITSGDIAQITIRQASNGTLTAELLTNHGSTESGGVIDATAWAKKDLNFNYGKGFNAGRLHFFQERHRWMFEEFSVNSDQASDTGNADCE